MARCRYCKKDVHGGRYQHELYCPENPNRAVPEETKKKLKSVWRFWNKCFLGRTRAYQPRKLKLEDSVRPTETTCPRCGKMALSLVYVDDEYLFDWHEIPGVDEVKILKFLSRKYLLDLLGAVIEKTNAGRNIKITTKTNDITLGLNCYKDEVSLKIDGNKEVKIYARNEDSKIKVYDDTGMVCRSCKIEIETVKLEGARKEIRAKNIELAEKFRDLLDDCQKKGTCDILAAHRELLKDDDQRLNTSVMLELVCKNEYGDRWNELLDNMEAKIESEKLEFKKRIGAKNGNEFSGGMLK